MNSTVLSSKQTSSVVPDNDSSPKNQKDRPKSQNVIPVLKKNNKTAHAFGPAYYHCVREAVFEIPYTPFQPQKIPDSLKLPDSNPETFYVCGQCKDSFRFSSTLEEHISRRSWILGYWCQHCFQTKCDHVPKGTPMCSNCLNTQFYKRAYLRSKGMKKNQKAAIIKLFYNQCQFFDHLKNHNITSVEISELMLMPMPFDVKKEEYEKLEKACKSIMEYGFLNRLHVMEFLREKNVEGRWWDPPQSGENSNNYEGKLSLWGIINTFREGDYVDSSAKKISSNQIPTPGNKTPTPGNKTPTPGNKTPTPTNKTPTPANRTPTPANKTPTPANKTPTPANKTPTPANKTPTPANKTPTPASKTPTPANKTPAPENKNPSPSNKNCPSTNSSISTGNLSYSSSNQSISLPVTNSLSVKYFHSPYRPPADIAFVDCGPSHSVYKNNKLLSQISSPESSRASEFFVRSRNSPSGLFSKQISHSSSQSSMTSILSSTSSNNKIYTMSTSNTASNTGPKISVKKFASEPVPNWGALGKNPDKSNQAQPTNVNTKILTVHSEKCLDLSSIISQLPPDVMNSKKIVFIEQNSNQVQYQKNSQGSKNSTHMSSGPTLSANCVKVVPQRKIVSTENEKRHLPILPASTSQTNKSAQPILKNMLKSNFSMNMGSKFMNYGMTNVSKPVIKTVPLEQKVPPRPQFPQVAKNPSGIKLQQINSYDGKVFYQSGKKFVIKQTNKIKPTSISTSSSVLKPTSQVANTIRTVNNTIQTPKSGNNFVTKTISKSVPKILQKPVSVISSSVSPLTPSTSPSELSSSSSCDAQAKRITNYEFNPAILSQEDFEISSSKFNIRNLLDKNEKLLSIRVDAASRLFLHVSANLTTPKSSVAKYKQNLLNTLPYLSIKEIQIRIEHISNLCTSYSTIMKVTDDKTIYEYKRFIGLLMEAMEQAKILNTSKNTKGPNQNQKESVADDNLEIVVNNWERQEMQKCNICKKIKKPDNYLAGFSNLSDKELYYCQCYNCLCSTCDRFQGILSRFAAHNHFHTKADPYVCPECYKRFVTFDMLEKHVWLYCFHPMIKNWFFGCRICGIDGLTTLESLTKHFLIMHSKRGFVCLECKEIFFLERNCREHLKLQHQRETHNQNEAEKRENDEKKADPKNLSDPVEIVMCKIGNCVVLKENFTKHLVDHLGVDEQAFYKCPFCSLTRRHDKNVVEFFREHMISNHSHDLTQFTSLRIIKMLQRQKSKEEVLPMIVNPRTIAPEAFEKGTQDEDTYESEKTLPAKKSGVPMIVDIRSEADDLNSSDSEPKIVEIKSIASDSSLKVSQGSESRKRKASTVIEITLSPKKISSVDVTNGKIDLRGDEIEICMETKGNSQIEEILLENESSIREDSIAQATDVHKDNEDVNKDNEVVNIASEDINSGNKDLNKDQDINIANEDNNKGNDDVNKDKYVNIANEDINKGHEILIDDNDVNIVTEDINKGQEILIEDNDVNIVTEDINKVQEILIGDNDVNIVTEDINKGEEILIEDNDVNIVTEDINKVQEILIGDNDVNIVTEDINKGQEILIEDNDVNIVTEDINKGNEVVNKDNVDNIIKEDINKGTEDVNKDKDVNIAKEDINEDSQDVKDNMDVNKDKNVNIAKEDINQGNEDVDKDKDVNITEEDINDGNEDINKNQDVNIAEEEKIEGNEDVNKNQDVNVAEKDINEGNGGVNEGKDINIAREDINEGKEDMNQDKEDIRKVNRDVNEGIEDINKDKEDVIKDKEDIDKNNEDIDEDNEDVDKDNEDVNQDKDVNKHKEDVIQDKRDVNEDEEKVNTYKEDVNKDKEDIKNDNKDIIKDTTSANKVNVATIIDNVATNKDNVATKEVNVATNEDNVATNKDTVATNEDNVATIKYNVATDKDNVATNEVNVATNKDNVATNEENVATNKDDVATNEDNIATNKDNVAVEVIEASSNDNESVNEDNESPPKDSELPNNDICSQTNEFPDKNNESSNTDGIINNEIATTVQEGNSKEIEDNLSIREENLVESEENLKEEKSPLNSLKALEDLKAKMSKTFKSLAKRMEATTTTLQKECSKSLPKLKDISKNIENVSMSSFNLGRTRRRRSDNWRTVGRPDVNSSFRENNSLDKNSRLEESKLKESFISGGKIDLTQPPPLSRIPQHLLKSQESTEFQSSKRVKKRKQSKIAFNGPLNYDETVLDFKCHVCSKLVDSSWPVLKAHFDIWHPDEYTVFTLNPKLLKISSDYIDGGYKEVLSKKIKCESSPRKRRRRNRFAVKSPEKASLEKSVGICVTAEPVEENDGMFKCKKCDFKVSDMDILREHISKRHRIKGRYLVCLECGENFVVAPSLQMHLKAFHAIDDPLTYLLQNTAFAPENLDDTEEEEEEETTDSNQCYVCMAVFEDKAAVDKHLRVHGMAFLNRKRIEAKKNLNSPEKKFKTAPQSEETRNGNSSVISNPDIVREESQIKINQVIATNSLETEVSVH